MLRILICSSNNALNKFVTKFLRKVLLRSVSFISSDVSKSLVEVVEYTSVSDESDDGVIGGTGENQLVAWVESIEDSWLLSGISKSLPTVIVRDVIDDVDGEDTMVEVVGVNSEFKFTSIDMNDAGIWVLGEITFATIVCAETDLVSKSTLFSNFANHFLRHILGSEKEYPHK